MNQLTEGAIDKIMNGEDVEHPILQYLGNKRLASSNNADRYRLLLSDGKRINSFTMLATQLNPLITDGILTEFSIVDVTRYAISMVNNGGRQKRVMVILNLEIKTPGSNVGVKIGNPNNCDNTTEMDTGKKPMQTSSVQINATATTLQKNMNQSSNDLEKITTPIAALSPYQNRWIIKARVTSKSAIRTWSNSRGEGKLFSMDLVDETGEIRCTAFRDQVDKFYDLIEAGKIYYISRCTLKSANKQFSNLKNDYEITLNGESEVICCNEDTDDIPTLKFDFSPISEVEKKEKFDMIDILGVVKSCTDVQSLTARTTGRDLKKRDISLVDESSTMVTLTLWGQEAEDFDGSHNPVIAIKSARVSEFSGGKSLSTISGSVVQIDPDIPEAHRLRGWFNAVGRSEEAKSISKSFGGGGLNGPWLTFKQVKEQHNELGDSPGNYTVKATVNMIRSENILYKSCPSEGCKKKMIDQSNEMYRCEKCARDYPNFKYRMLASANLADGTDNQWVTLFNEEAEKLLGISAQELGELQENNADEFLQKLADVTFKSFLFQLRVKREVFNDEARLKTICISLTMLDFKVYNAYLIKEIKELASIGKN